MPDNGNLGTYFAGGRDGDRQLDLFVTHKFATNTELFVIFAPMTVGDA